jgi:hypothetical protein
LRDYVAALLAPRDRNKTLTSLAKPVTAPHDGGALFPDDSGARKSGHATASVSHQYLGSRGQVGKGIVAAATARIVSLYGRLRGWTEQVAAVVALTLSSLAVPASASGSTGTVRAGIDCPSGYVCIYPEGFSHVEVLFIFDQFPEPDDYRQNPLHRPGDVPFLKTDQE